MVAEAELEMPEELDAVLEALAEDDDDDEEPLYVTIMRISSHWPPIHSS